MFHHTARADVAEPPAHATHANPTALFEDVLRRYERSVIVAAYRITRNIDDARDVAQYVFMQVYVNLAKFTDGRSIDRWLYVVMRNEALNVNRRRQRDGIAERSISTEPAQLGLEETVLRNERARQVRATIAILPSAYRDVIELRHLRSLPSAEIALQLGIPLKRVKRDVERAKSRLRIEMLRVGFADDANAATSKW